MAVEAMLSFSAESEEMDRCDMMTASINQSTQAMTQYLAVMLPLLEASKRLGSP
jgi:hypothetical protein